MRTLLVIAAVLMLAALVMAEETQKPWFDLQKCAFCKELAAQPGLMEHMRHEYHNIHNGILSITHIDKDYWDEFANMQTGMQKVVAEMQSGKPLEMCQHCSKLGEFYMKGVKVDDIKSSDAIIIVYSSDDTTMVAELQAFGARTADEMAKFAETSEKPKAQ